MKFSVTREIEGGISAARPRYNLPSSNLATFDEIEARTLRTTLNQPGARVTEHSENLTRAEKLIGFP